MHFIINKEVLSTQINILQKGLPVKTPLPVLNAIKLEVYEKEIILTSNNSDLTIQSVIRSNKVTIKQTGKIAIPGKFLGDIIRKVDSPEIEFKTQNDNSIIIKADRSEFHLRLMDVQDYPTINFINQEDSIKVNTLKLQEVIRQTSFSASDDEKRPILTGINFHTKGKNVVAVSTNGFRLSQKVSIIDKEIDPFNISIPRKSLDELQKILDITGVEEVNISLSPKQVLFSFADFILQTRLFEGTYPDTDKVIPKDFLIKVPFQKNDLLAAVERVSLLSPKEKEKYNVIRLTLNKDKTVTLSSVNDEIGEASDIVIPNGDVQGEEISIAFSSKYLIEAIRSFRSKDIELNFINSKKPFTVSSLQEKNLLQIILPVSFN